MRGGVISILEILLVDGMSYGVLGLCWSIMVIHLTRTTTLCTSQKFVLAIGEHGIGYIIGSVCYFNAGKQEANGLFST